MTIASLDENGRRPDLGEAERLITQRGYVMGVKADGDALDIQVDDGGAAAPDLLTLLHDNKFAATNLSVSSPTLDDVFLKYTGRAIRTESAEGDEAAQMMRPWLGLKRR